MPRNVLIDYTLTDITTSSQRFARFLSRFIDTHIPVGIAIESPQALRQYHYDIAHTGNMTSKVDKAIKLSRNFVMLRDGITAHFMGHPNNQLGEAEVKSLVNRALTNYIMYHNIDTCYGWYRQLSCPQTIVVEIWRNGASIPRFIHEVYDEGGLVTTEDVFSQSYTGLFRHNTDGSMPPQPRPYGSYTVSSTRQSNPTSVAINRDAILPYEARVEDNIDGVRAYMEENCWGTNKFIIGLELEAEGTRRSVTDTIMDQFDDYCILKRDGSLSERSGFEIVTRPEVPDYHRKNMGQLLEATRGQMISYNTNTCGLHIHVNVGFYNLEKGSDGGYLSANPVTLAKLYTFMYNPANYGFLKRIAQRDWINNPYCVRPKQLSKVTQAIRAEVDFAYSFATKDVNYDKRFNLDTDNLNQHRKVALNLTNKDTLEFRMFKGTCNKISLLAKIDFVEAVSYWVKSKSASMSELTVPKFIEWLAKEPTYNYLKTFIHKFEIEGYDKLGKFKNMEKEDDINDSDISTPTPATTQVTATTDEEWTSISVREASYRLPYEVFEWLRLNAERDSRTDSFRIPIRVIPNNYREFFNLPERLPGTEYWGIESTTYINTTS